MIVRCAPISVKLVGWNRQTVVLAKRAPPVLLPKQPLAAQNRHHVLDERLQPRRQRWCHDVESVRGPSLEPRHDGVNRLVRRPDEGEVTAAATEIRKDLSHSQVRTCSHVDDEI